jgi:chromosome segregation ATPase
MTPDELIATINNNRALYGLFTELPTELVNSSSPSSDPFYNSMRAILANKRMPIASIYVEASIDGREEAKRATVIDIVAICALFGVDIATAFSGKFRPLRGAPVWIIDSENKWTDNPAKWCPSSKTRGHIIPYTQNFAQASRLCEAVKLTTKPDTADGKKYQLTKFKDATNGVFREEFITLIDQIMETYVRVRLDTRGVVQPTASVDVTSDTSVPNASTAEDPVCASPVEETAASEPEKVNIIVDSSTEPADNEPEVVLVQRPVAALIDDESDFIPSKHSLVQRPIAALVSTSVKNKKTKKSTKKSSRKRKIDDVNQPETSAAKAVAVSSNDTEVEKPARRTKKPRVSDAAIFRQDATSRFSGVFAMFEKKKKKKPNRKTGKDTLPVVASDDVTATSSTLSSRSSTPSNDDRITELTAKIELLEKRTERYRNTASKRKELLNEVTAKHNELVDSYTDLGQEYDQMKIKFKTARKQCKQSDKLLEKAKDEFANVVASIQEDMTKRADDFESAIDKNKRDAAMIKSLEEQVEELTQRSAIVGVAVSAREVDLEQRLRESEKQIASLKALEADANARANSLVITVDERSSEIARLLHENAVLAKEKKDIIAEIDSIRPDYEKDRSEIVASMNAISSECNERIKKLDGTIETQNKELEQLRENLRYEQARCDEYKSKIDNLETLNRTGTLLYDEQSGRMASLEAKLSEAQNRSAELQRSVDALQQSRAIEIETIRARMFAAIQASLETNDPPGTQILSSGSIAMPFPNVGFDLSVSSSNIEAAAAAAAAIVDFASV